MSLREKGIVSQKWTLQWHWPTLFFSSLAFCPKMPQLCNSGILYWHIFSIVFWNGKNIKSCSPGFGGHGCLSNYVNLSLCYFLTINFKICKMGIKYPPIWWLYGLSKTIFVKHLPQYYRITCRASSVKDNFHRTPNSLLSDLCLCFTILM